MKTITIDGKEIVVKDTPGRLRKTWYGRYVLEFGAPPGTVTLQKMLGYPKTPVELQLFVDTNK